MAGARRSWDDALALGLKHGYRNAQATVLAPTGTIAFMMDCDTTGVEPDLALVKYKKLVGGGLFKIVNNTVPLALKQLGYDVETMQRISAYIDENDTIEGAPELKEEHLPVFVVRPSAQTKSGSLGDAVAPRETAGSEKVSQAPSTSPLRLRARAIGPPRRIALSDSALNSASLNRRLGRSAARSRTTPRRAIACATGR